ncbi:MAG: hypothetical protein ACYTAF_16120, partial [Planctomycetota bacterium]
NPALPARVKKLRKDARTIETEHRKTEVHRATLRKDPDDAEANHAIGRFLCGFKAQWEEALTFLTRGPGGAFRALAEKEVQEPQAGSACMDIAEGWWDIAQKSKDLEEENYLARACVWYRRALKEVTGLSRLKAEKRLRSRLPKFLEDLNDITDKKWRVIAGMQRRGTEVVMDSKGAEAGVLQTVLNEPVSPWTDFAVIVVPEQAYKTEFQVGIEIHLRPENSPDRLLFEWQREGCIRAWRADDKAARDPDSYWKELGMLAVGPIPMDRDMVLHLRIVSGGVELALYGSDGAALGRMAVPFKMPKEYWLGARVVNGRAAFREVRAR